MVDTAATNLQHVASRRIVQALPIFVRLLLLIGVFAIAFLPTLRWIVTEWGASSGTLGHGYLVAAISVYLLLASIPDAASLEQKPALWILPGILGLSVVWLFGYVATVAAIQSVILPAILLLAVAAAFGIAVARRLAFPILFMYLALPVLRNFQFIFQYITVFVNRLLVDIFGIPAFVDGNFVNLPAGTLEIAGGCSGLNFIVAGLSLAILYAHLFYNRLRPAIRLIVLTLLVAIASNSIRVFTVIVIGYQTQMQSPLVGDHLTMGWILFAIAMVPVFLFAVKWEPSGAKDESAKAAVSNAKPVHTHWLAVIAVTAAMISGPLWAKYSLSPQTSGETAVLRLPDAGGNWLGPANTDWPWQPKFEGPDAEQLAEYRNGDRFVLTYVNAYQSQQQGKELIYFSNDVSGDWETQSESHTLVTVPTQTGAQEFNQIVATNYLGDWVLWYRYVVGSKFESSQSRAKISQALEAISGRPRAGLIAFAAPCRESCTAASVTLVEFVEEFGHTINIDTSGNME